MLDTSLTASEFFDFDHPEVIAFANRVLADVQPTPLARISALYLAVRDGFAYNPYQFNMTAEQYRASDCVQQQQSYCIPKAVLLGALARSIGIPARLGLADVRNHISSPRLLRRLQTDVFVMHGYTDLYINGRWLKATPAFDAKLCARIGIDPLEFTGTQDSVFQKYNLSGSKHMEYLRDHGSFTDVPVDFIHDQIRQAYPHMFTDEQHGLDAWGESLERDLAAS